MTFQELIDSIKPEQMIKLYQHIQPLSEAEEAEYGAMTDDELLAALGAE